MRSAIYSIMILLCLCTTGCVRRTLSDRPGWKSSKSDKLLTIMPDNQKVESSRIIWFWQDGFHKPKKFDQKPSADTTAETNNTAFDTNTIYYLP